MQQWPVMFILLHFWRDLVEERKTSSCLSNSHSCELFCRPPSSRSPICAINDEDRTPGTIYTTTITSGRRSLSRLSLSSSGLLAPLSIVTYVCGKYAAIARQLYDRLIIQTRLFYSCSYLQIRSYFHWNGHRTCIRNAFQGEWLGRRLIGLRHVSDVSAGTVARKKCFPSIPNLAQVIMWAKTSTAPKLI